MSSPVLGVHYVLPYYILSSNPPPNLVFVFKVLLPKFNFKDFFFTPNIDDIHENQEKNWKTEVYERAHQDGKSEKPNSYV